MLFKQQILPQIRDGTVTLAFRRWRRPTVKAGSQLKTPVGVLAIESVTPMLESRITDAEARRAGASDLTDLLAHLPTTPGTQLYRIAFRFAGADPRIALRNDAALSAADLSALRARLDRFDATAAPGPWTRRTLRAIQTHPGLPAGDLATHLRLDKDWLKIHVRKLKNLGLTESLNPGYRLSPRGVAWLSHST